MNHWESTVVKLITNRQGSFAPVAAAQHYFTSPSAPRSRAAGLSESEFSGVISPAPSPASAAHTPPTRQRQRLLDNAVSPRGGRVFVLPIYVQSTHTDTQAYKQAHK